MSPTHQSRYIRSGHGGTNPDRRPSRIDALNVSRSLGASFLGRSIMFAFTLHIKPQHLALAFDRNTVPRFRRRACSVFGSHSINIGGLFRGGEWNEM